MTPALEALASAMAQHAYSVELERLETQNPLQIHETWEELSEDRREWWRQQERISIAAIEAHGCWIAPNEPTREMWAASGNVIVSGKLSSPKSGPKKNHDIITAAVFGACRDHAPYAPSSNDEKEEGR